MPPHELHRGGETVITAAQSSVQWFFSLWSSILKRGEKAIFSPKKMARNLPGLFTHLSNTGTLKGYKRQRSLYSASAGNEVPGLETQTSAGLSPPPPESSPAPRRPPSARAKPRRRARASQRVARAGPPRQASLRPAPQDGWRGRWRVELRPRRAALRGPRGQLVPA